MTDISTNLPANANGQLPTDPGLLDPADGSTLIAQTAPGSTPGQELDADGDGIVSYEELGPEARAAIDRIRAGVNPSDLNSSTEVIADNDIIELVEIDGVLSTQVDPGGNLWAFIYPSVTLEQAEANPEVLLETPPVVFLSVNAPIPQLGGSKPVFSINLNAGEGADIVSSFEGGLGNAAGAFGGNAFYNARVGGLGDGSATVRGTGGVFWGANGQPGLKLASSYGTANGIWHTLQAINDGALDALPEALRDSITEQFGDVEMGQEAFIAAYGSTAFATAGKQGIGFAYTGTVAGNQLRLNSGELATTLALGIPNGNTTVRFDVDVSQYEAAALDNPFVVDRDNPNDVAYLDGWLEERLVLADPLGETALPGARSFASFLYDHYTGRGLDQDEALARIEIDLTGGPGSYEARIFQLIADSPPDTLTRQAFADVGYGQIASFPATATAERLIADGATAQEAWTEVARIYADGFTDASEFGIYGGGFSGGLAALQGNLEAIGVDPTGVFEQGDVSDADLVGPPPLSDTVTGDLIAQEVTGNQADDVIQATLGKTISIERDDRIGAIVEQQDITLADGTEAIYLRTDSGNVFVVLDRSTFLERNVANLDVSAAVFALRGSSVAEIEAMVLEQNPGDFTDRLVSPVDPGISSQTIQVPRFTDLDVAVSGQRDPTQFGGEGLTPTFREVVLADGSTGTLITYRNDEGSIVEGYLQVFVDGQEWYFDRTSAAPTPDRSLLIADGTGAPIMVQIDDIDAPGGEGALGDLFADGTVRRQELPNGGTAIYGTSEDGARSVIYIAPGGAIRLLDVTNVAEDTVIDLLLREGSSALGQDVLVPRDADAVEFESFGDTTFLIPETNTLVVAAADGVQLIDSPAGVTGQLPDPSSLTGPALRFQQDMQALLYDAEGNELDIFTPEEASGIAYSNYQLLALDGDGAGLSNNAYRDARFEARSDTAPVLDRDAYNAVFDPEFDRLANLIIPSQIGDAGARAELEAAGISFLPDGRIDESTGSAVALVSRASGDLASDPAINAAVAALGDSPTPTAVALAIQSVTTGVDNSEFLNDVGALRGQVAEQISNLETLGGNDAALAFLRTFDLSLGVIEATGGDFNGTAIGEFLSSGSGSIGYFLSQIGAGDAAAWSAFTADLGGFVTTLTDGQRNTLREEAYGLSLAGSFLVLTGTSGDTPNDAAIISGELLTIAGDGLLAAAGEIPAGFESVPSTEFAIGSGFGRLLGRYADRTDTPIDDIGAVLLEDGLPAWDALRTGSVVNDAGEEVFNGNLVGAAILSSAGGAILNDLIGGDAGRILQAVGDGASTGILLAAGAINPAQAIISGVDVFFDAIGIEVPPEVQLGALVALAAVNASNPVGWIALAVQVVFQFASMRDFTVVTDIAPGIDADGDGAFDDIGQVSTDYSTNFWGSTSATGGRLQYEVVSPNDLRLQSATFDLADNPIARLNVRDDDDDGIQAEITVNGETYEGAIVSSRGRQVSFDGYVGSGRDKDKVTSATFVSADGTIEVPVRVYEHGHDDDDNAYGALFELTDAAFETVPPNYRVTISGVYDPINPGVGTEEFNQTISVSAEEYAQLQLELGSTDPVTLDGTNPLLGGPNNPDAPVNTIQTVMDRVEVTFEGAKRDANLYQYLDMNGDGNPDLVRYGISAGGDGLNSGDERYEVTLLGPNLTNLGLPTILHPDINEAANIASLTPYLMQWAASRPEVYQYGYDPVSIMNVADEHGDLDALLELRDLDMALARDYALMAGTLTNGETITEEVWANVQSSIETNPETTQRRSNLADGLNLFDASAYLEANPGLGDQFGNNGMQLAFHYMSAGNDEGRAINTDGAVLEVGRKPVWTRNRSVGSELRAGEQLLKNEMLVSENGQYAARYTENGDFYIADVSGAEPDIVWQADTYIIADNDGAVVMQEDGNLVVYDHRTLPSFSTRTDSETGPAHGSFVLRMENDGRLVIHDQLEGDVLWSGGVGDGESRGDGVRNRRAAPGNTTPNADATDSANAAREDIMFDDLGALTYLASDLDLVAAYAEQGGDPVLFARQHFEETGQFAPVSIDFDPDLYISAPGNDDLYIAFADDPEGATNHFITAGFTEKEAGLRPQLRLNGNDTPNQASVVYSDIMDTRSGALRYLASSPPLANAYLAEGGDPVAWARSHFETVGWQSEITLDFNPENYISAPGNDDLAAVFWDDPVGAIEHFIMFGVTENVTSGRQLALNEGETQNQAAVLMAEVFGSEEGALTYIASSPDLTLDAHNSGATDLVSYARNHLTESGWKENRQMGFDPQSYIMAPGNDDLAAAFWDDPVGATEHFIMFGVGENKTSGRQLALNEGETQNQASVLMAEVFGSEEGALTYIASSPDLALDARETGSTDLVAYARNHLTEVGWSENRQMDFDGVAYLADHPDLVDAFGSNVVDALTHYIEVGQDEIGRIVGDQVVTEDGLVDRDLLEDA